MAHYDDNEQVEIIVSTTNQLLQAAFDDIADIVGRCKARVALSYDNRYLSWELSVTLSGRHGKIYWRNLADSLYYYVPYNIVPEIKEVFAGYLLKEIEKRE